MKAETALKCLGSIAERSKKHSTSVSSNAEVNWIKCDGLFEFVGIEWAKLIIVAMVCTNQSTD